MATEGENAVDCSNNANLTFDQLLKAAITKDADGKKGLRVVFIEACEEDGVTCDTSHLTAEQLLRQCFTINECGKIALRLAQPAS